MTRLSRAMRLGVGLLGVLVLVGWSFDLDILKSGVPGRVAMNPATAISFILAALALELRGDGAVPKARDWFSLLCATIVVLVGASVFARYTLVWQLTPDQWLFRDQLAGTGAAQPNRMAPNTAFMFVLVGLSLLAMRRRDRLGWHCTELLALMTGFLGLTALIGYLYGARFLYGVSSSIPIALNTALAFGALAIAILTHRPGQGLAALVLSRSAGGLLLRRLLPAILGIPALLGLLRLEGQRAGLYDTAGGAAIMSALTVLLLGILVWWSAASLDRSDAARTRAEQEVRKVNEELEARVAQRTRELQEQKDFLRQVLDANPQLVFMKDWDGRFVLANRAVAELYGTTPDALEGKTDADFNGNAAEVENYLKADREVMRSGRPLHIPEESVTHSSGEVRWFQTMKVPLTRPDGRTRQVLGVSTDITARREVKEQLRKTANELEALMQAAPVAIVGIDLNGKVTSWYGRAEAMFGWSAAEVVGRPLANVPPEKQEEFSALRSRVAREDSILDLETYRVRKDGSRIDVSICYAPLHDRAGETIGATIVYQDVTERRLMAEQRQAREAAEAANQAKSNFLANMSHELRTPLNAIIGFSELLQDQTFGPLNEKQQRYVANVHSSGRHLLQLVNDILDLAKVEAGRLVLEPESVNLKTLLEEMQRGLEPLATAKRQTLVLEGAEKAPQLIADRAKLKQILYNLLSNAIKFTQEGGRLGLRVAPLQVDQSQPQVQIEVWDTGIGIAPEDIKRVFLEFEQLDSSYVREQEGTGLGLALTKRLVEAHGGRIWVESTPDKGSTFTFVLPAPNHEIGKTALTPAPVRFLGRDRERPLVLVVEDDSTGRELLAHYLMEHGYAAAYAGTGAEALEVARRLKPDAISLDILLPDVHGLQVLSELRSDPETKDIPVIVVSITDDRERGLSAGAAAWLVKPVQRQQFIEALDRVMPQGITAGNKLALVVDDDAEAVELASDILRQRGFEVLQAFGGSEGLIMALERLPSLIILDLSMPGMSGFTVAQQLRADPRTRRTPILVSTALDLSAAEREDLLRHVQTIVPKSGAEAILEALERLGLGKNQATAAASDGAGGGRSG